MRFTINDLANGEEVERHTMSRWIADLIKRKKFKKHSPGYGFSEEELKQISKLLFLDYDQIVKLRKEKSNGK